MDIFQPIIQAIEKYSEIEYGKNEKEDIAMRVIADHIRMLVFSISDGAMPSNEGRGYVLRRVLRRAVRYGDLLGIKDPFLSLLVDDLIALMGSAYPEIIDKINSFFGKIIFVHKTAPAVPLRFFCKTVFA